MKKIGKRIVLEASEGITFRMQEGAEEIVIRAIIENEKVCSDYSDNYKNPFIPEGYVHIKGTWDTGFVIQNKADGSEFTWIPIGYLDPDGMLDGVNFNEEFGRKNWYDSNFSEKGYHEEIPNEFIQSVKKYGGCYLSSYHASKEDGKLVFKQGNMPWVNINYPNAETAAAGYAKDSKDIASIITSGAVFDSLLRWIIKSNAKTYNQVVKDSTSWGNYWNSKNSPQKVMPTGSKTKWSVFNIYDIAGNVDEWTSEMSGSSCRVLRGGYCNYNGNDWPAASRFYNYPNSYFNHTSFRAVLFGK